LPEAASILTRKSNQSGWPWYPEAPSKRLVRGHMVWVAFESAVSRPDPQEGKPVAVRQKDFTWLDETQGLVSLANLDESGVWATSARHLAVAGWSLELSRLPS
jgi:hypothetical protein